MLRSLLCGAALGFSYRGIHAARCRGLDTAAADGTTTTSSASAAAAVPPPVVDSAPASSSSFWNGGWFGRPTAAAIDATPEGAAEDPKTALKNEIARQLTASPATTTATNASSRSSDDDDEVDPVRCVIVGGGYSGARMAYQLDSIFDVTLIDEKNYVEFRADLIPIICAPWTEKTDEALKSCHVLHRFYLKRANVVTNKVVDVQESFVQLVDGQKIPYDLLIVSTGEQAAFPYASHERTLARREQELRLMNQFVQEKCQRIAVVGAGPMGAATAYELATSYPDKKIELFQSSTDVMPNLPSGARARAEELVRSKENLTLHLRSRVTSVEMQKDPEAVVDGARKAGTGGGWFGMKKKNTAVSTPELESKKTTTSKFQLTVERRSGVTVQRPSILHQIFLEPSGVKKIVNTVMGELESTDVLKDFDYVFMCNGNTPRAVPASSTGPSLLPAHVDASGHFTVSKFMQLFGLPHVFAVGRCAALPWVRSMGNSDLQTRALFRNVVGVVTPQKATANAGLGRGGTSSPAPPTGSPTLALNSRKMMFPRLIMRFSHWEAAGSTAWAGSVVGPAALKEWVQDRQYFTRDFQKPMFFKPRDAKEVRETFDKWRAREVTDVSDFNIE